MERLLNDRMGMLHLLPRTIHRISATRRSMTALYASHSRLADATGSPDQYTVLVKRCPPFLVREFPTHEGRRRGQSPPLVVGLVRLGP